VPTPPIEERFREPTRAALIQLDPAADLAARDRAEKAALEALAQTLDEATREQLVLESERVKDLLAHVFEEVLVAANEDRLADIPPADLKSLIIAAVRRVAPSMELGLVPESESVGVVWAEPLGVLTTDHVGYASFDLKRLSPDVQVMLAQSWAASRTFRAPACPPTCRSLP
jgi:hypothetical protein